MTSRTIILIPVMLLLTGAVFVSLGPSASVFSGTLVSFTYAAEARTEQRSSTPKIEATADRVKGETTGVDIDPDYAEACTKFLKELDVRVHAGSAEKVTGYKCKKEK